MDTTILEVVLGLALIYGVLAMLVMQLQEQVGGNLLNYRSNVLHDLVLEACGQSQDLKQQVLAQPLVRALYREDEAEQRSVLWDKGPSAIPPTLFAKALLAALNGGTAPAPAHASPALFMAGAAPPASTTTTAATTDHAASSAADGEGRQRVWQALQALLPGHEKDWPGFEAAIAAWFKDIGDRSDGWFKRKASRWALSLSLLLVLALNVDSFHIANTLSQDPALRLGLADLAARVDSQRRSDAAGTGDQPAPPSAAAQPMQQLASRMTDAITRLNSAFADKAIGSFQVDLTPVYLACSIVRERSALDQQHPLQQSLGDTIDTDIQAARAKATKSAPDKADKGKPPAVIDGLPSLTASLSNADIWLRVLPIVQAKVEVAQLLPAQQAERIYRRGFECVAQVSSWVRTATVHSNSPEVRTQMQDAAAALESVKSALLTLAERQAPTLSLRRAFVNNPEAFDTCASNARDNRSSFDACLQRELRSGWNLPLFWGGSAMRSQFCAAVATWPDEENRAGNKDKPKEEKQAAGSGMFCAATPFAGDARLGLPALRLEQQQGWPWLAAGLGWLTTVLFVALGAPFWFDVMGKVMRLRSAGAVRDAEADAQRGRGTLPLPAPTSGGGSSAAGGTGDGEAPFSDSRNAFEDTLVPAAILRLQQKLPADATGRLDLQTRAALRSWCSANGVTPVVEELDEALYRRIVGRAASVATAGAGSNRLLLGQASARVPAIAAALQPVLRQNGRIGAAPTVFDADLRALAVLFRYHQQRLEGKAPRDCPVLQVPDSSPAQLDQVDEALATEIEDAARRNQRRTLEPPCWMDWAIGELGQVEHNAPSRAGSNPRICAYLDAAQPNAGDDGDQKPWCGAFVAWVLQSYDAYRRAHLADSERNGDPLSGAASTWTLPQGDRQKGWPLTAKAWETWGMARANWKKEARFGDVVLLKPQGAQSSGHVGFFIHGDDSRIWLLGGNQTGGSRVSMQSWDVSEVVAVLHPASDGFDPGI